MERNPFVDFDPTLVPSPCHVIELNELETNLLILDRIQKESGAKILMALKAFAMFHLAPQLMKYLAGTCASSLHEARLGREEFGKEVHTYSPGYRPSDMEQILELSDHVIFNSFHQINRFKAMIDRYKKQKPHLQIGVRINPEYSVGVTTPIYDPSANYSRMGTVLSEFEKHDPEFLDGIHFHNLCEQNVKPLIETVEAVEKKFGKYLNKMKWVNFGGGHHLTRKNYDVDGLIELIKYFQKKYDVQVYLEPGEAVAWSIGILVSEVLDITFNGKPIAVVDISATAHMPDVLEMPYTPEIVFSSPSNEYKYEYRIGGATCLTGDIIGDYSFKNPLKVGDRIMFADTAYYTMVKSSDFNGITRPAIATWNHKNHEVHLVKTFHYDSYKNSLS